jgi:hypothetical protein
MPADPRPHPAQPPARRRKEKGALGLFQLLGLGLLLMIVLFVLIVVVQSLFASD